MAYEEKMKTGIKPHTVKMENRCKMTVTGVEDVESFDETEIVMSTSQGDLVARGNGLHIGSINLDAGELKVEGLISELLYEEKRVPSGSLWSRMFG